MNLPQRIFRTLIASAAALVFALTPTGDARAAADGPEASSDEMPIRVIQRRPNLRTGRFEVIAMGGGGLSDTMFNHAAVTGSGRYHINEFWSLAAGYSHHIGETSSLFDEVTDRFELFPERSIVEWSAGLDIGWTPVFGKFALVESYIIHFDMTLILGGSAVVTSRSPEPKFGGSAGVSMRLYLSPWLALTGEVRDQVYVESYNAGDELVNHVLAQAGFSVFFPFEYAYKYPR